MLKTLLGSSANFQKEIPYGQDITPLTKTTTSIRVECVSRVLTHHLILINDSFSAPASSSDARSRRIPGVKRFCFHSVTHVSYYVLSDTTRVHNTVTTLVHDSVKSRDVIEDTETFDLISVTDSGFVNDLTSPLSIPHDHRRYIQLSARC